MAGPFNDETLLARWLSGELTEAERKEVEQHPDFERWRRIARAAEQLQPPPYDQRAAWERLRAAAASKKRRSKLRPLIAAGAIAAALALLIAFFFLLPGRESIRTQIGEKQAVTLPDGASVRLNAVSSLSYSERGFAEARDVHLDGEAYFEVRPGLPFTVQTGRGRVEVLGTRFNVYDRADELSVQCYEGRVRVIVPPADTLTLTAGQGARLRGGRLARSSPGATDRPGWTEGVTQFTDTPPALVFQEMMRHYEVNILYEALPAKRYTGPLPHDNLRQALEIVCKALGLSFIFIDDTTVRIEEQ